MSNRIENLIKKGLKNKTLFDKELETLALKISEDPDLKKEVRKEFDSSLAKRGSEIKELSLRAQLEDIAELISLSYIARHYFKKSRGWLTQRINRNIVNGKPAKFTKEEIETLNFALKDMGKKISSITIHG